MNFKFLYECCFPQKEKTSDELNARKEWNEIEKKDDTTSLEKCDNKEEDKYTLISKNSHNSVAKFGQNGFQNDIIVDTKTPHEKIPKSNSFPYNLNTQNGNKLRDSKLDESCITEILGSSRKINDDEVKNAPTIVIEETDGNLLKNEMLYINAKGLVNSKRQGADGITFFGTKLMSPDNVTILNDYAMNIDFQENLSHIFIIYYKKETNKYYIRAYKEKHIESFPIVLIKLENQFIIKKKQIIKIDAYFFHVIPLDDGLEVHKMYTRKESTKEKQKFTFKFSDSPVTIGRNKDCNISFVGDRAFSRIHCHFKYDIQQKFWIIKDGFEKPSTNGIWIYAKHSYELINGLCFRVQNSIFRVSIKDS